MEVPVIVRQPVPETVPLMKILAHTHSAADCSETIVCHCLEISESTVADAIAICGLTSVKEVCRETGAGAGCTACHGRLRDMLRKTNQSVPVC
jgi:NAD(P)H-nitrite reductase large subunit